MRSIEGPSGQWYAHNGDFSGVVKASVPLRSQTRYPENDWACASVAHTVAGETGDFVEVEIPFEDIRALYLEYLRSERISRLEQATYGELEYDLVGIPQQPFQALPPQGPPSWVAEEMERRKKLAEQSEPAGDLATGYMYQHGEKPGLISRIDRLPKEGYVLFSLWNPNRPYGWQGGAVFNNHDQFRKVYPYRYRGPEPEIQKHRE